jgi:hypothetical protein
MKRMIAAGRFGRAFGHLEHRLSGGGRVLAAEGALLDIVEELGSGNPVGDDDASVDDLRAARRHERAEEHHLLGVLADVDEPAASGELRPEPADVDVARRVGRAMPRNAASRPPPS